MSASETQKELQRFEQEALGNPWVLGAILEREFIVDEIARNGGATHNPPEMYDRLQHARNQAYLRKALIEDSHPKT